MTAVTVKNIKFFLLYFLLITLLIGCSSRKIYIVSVIETSRTEEPYWLKHHFSGEMMGVGEATSKEAAYRYALQDIKIKVAEEIGLELELRQLQKKVEQGVAVTETTYVELGVLSDAILRDINTRVSDSFWEHCRAQTGRKSFSDFFRYYIKADITPSFIDTLRTLTRTENEKRLKAMQEHLTEARRLAEDSYPLEPMTSLQEYIQALSMAKCLLFNRELNTRICMNEIYELVSNISLKLITPYSEVRPECHYLKYMVTIANVPAVGVRVISAICV